MMVLNKQTVCIIFAIITGVAVGLWFGYSIGTMRCNYYSVDYMATLSEKAKSYIEDSSAHQWMRIADISVLHHYKIIVPNIDGAQQNLASAVLKPVNKGYPMVELFDYNTNGTPDKVIIVS